MLKPKPIIRRNKYVDDVTPSSKTLVKTSYNRLTKTGRSKETQIEFDSGSKRVYTNKEVAKRDKDLNIKSNKQVQKLKIDGKLIKKEKTPSTFKKK